jgi:protein-L-isoaspartate(D-aspartate) O-methyltransferase
MTLHAPIPDYSAARQAMVDSQLKPQGASGPEVVAAMSVVPRELFVPEAQRPLAYIERAVPLGEARAMPPAAVLGLLLTALVPQPGQRALVVGAGTGYAAAVLEHIGLETVALESSPELAGVARDRGLNVVEGPLENGHRAGAPYDLILIDGAVETIPDALVDQLKDGGRLGAALVDEGVTRLAVGLKAAGGFGIHSISDSAAPVLPGFNKPRAFTF